MSDKKYTVFMLCAGMLLLAVCSLHRLLLVYGSDDVYVHTMFVLSVIIPFLVFLIFVIVYIPIVIAMRIMDKKIKYFMYNLLVFVFSIIILFLSMYIDAPTLVYMT